MEQVCWAWAPVDYRFERLMGSDFNRLDYVLDGGELRVHLRPHPQAGKGTTPMVEVYASGSVSFRELLP